LAAKSWLNPWGLSGAADTAEIIFVPLLPVPERVSLNGKANFAFGKFVAIVIPSNGNGFKIEFGSVGNREYMGIERLPMPPMAGALLAEIGRVRSSLKRCSNGQPLPEACVIHLKTWRLETSGRE